MAHKSLTFNRLYSLFFLFLATAALPTFASDRATPSVKSDKAVPADYDGDGKIDRATWRSRDGRWSIRRSSDGTLVSLKWGQTGDIPVQADYDGDARADLAVFRPSENSWHIMESGSGASYVKSFGIAGTDILVPADYTGDGKADFAVYRRNTWLILNSETGEIETFYFGYSDATPAPADYDGDGETDFAFVRKGILYVYESFAPRLKSYHNKDMRESPLSVTIVKKSTVS